MKFKHTFHVFVDNFSIVFKHLLYGLIVVAITAGLSCAIIFPATGIITDTAQYAALSEAFGKLWESVVNLNAQSLQSDLSVFRTALNDFLQIFTTDKAGMAALCLVLLTLVYLVNRFLLSIGNYTAGALINDKMALHADSPFFATLVKNLGKASLYSVIYVPLSFLYDVCAAVIIWAVFFLWLHFLPILAKIFLFTTVFLILIALKLTFTTDWLPSLIHARTTNRKAIAYTFSRRNKRTANVFSNFIVMVLIILAVNVAALLFTFGAGVLIAVPASYLILVSFEFVNYCDANRLRYFVAEDSVVGPKQEKPLSREQFFKGEE